VASTHLFVTLYFLIFINKIYKNDKYYVQQFKGALGMRVIKKIMSAVLAVVCCMAVFSGCGLNENEIYLVSREDGSGTRDAFTGLTGIKEKDNNGEMVDNTSVRAEITNSTSVMLITVAGNGNAIGYVSFGSLNDSVKALKIDGIAATAENVRNESYLLSRPFNIITGDNGVSEAAQDFINYICSTEGQSTVADCDYVSVKNGGSYSSSGLSGHITVGGSSSVTPLMQVLAEKYMDLNPDMTVDIEQSDSTTGVISVIEGIFDIGMTSRDLKESEISKGVKSETFAKDCIAVIVNKSNPLDEISSDMLKAVFTGKITGWRDIS
jgi:phosphate transport system substrate-binding protein